MIVNTLGTLGYMSLIIQWAWTMMTVVLPRIPPDFDWLFFFNDSSAPKPAPIVFDMPDFIAWAMAGIVTVIMIIITIVTLVRLPKTVGKQGAKVTHATATRALPLITRHKKATKNERARLSYRIVIALKISAMVLALALLVFAQPTNQMTTEMVMVIGAICAAFTGFYFGLQALLVHTLHINRSNVW